MAALKLRDRDAIITEEGLIFRVLGYTHLRDAYICDAEYAPSQIFKSNNPKAFRTDGKRVFYKFYEDEGWKFVMGSFPHHVIPHPMLQKKVLGVEHHNIAEVRRPEEELRKLVEKEPKDELLKALQNVLEITTQHSGLREKSFGVFGSLLHGFYHPKFSDIDLIIYSRDKAHRLRKTLRELYESRGSPLKNEFDGSDQIKAKNWRFQNHSPQEFGWHQRRKMFYALFHDKKSGRIIKTEFEPVKDWVEIDDTHSPETRIVQKGWVKMLARVTDDQDAPFMPSVYGIEPIRILQGTKGAGEAKRLVSYMEEFRAQVYKDEEVYLEGALEEVMTPDGNFHQVTLTYCPRYYEQVLKVVSTSPLC